MQSLMEKKSKAKKKAAATKASRKRTVQTKVAAATFAKCPKCGGRMVKGVCEKCKYSPRTAYKSRREAKEFTFAAD